MGIKTLPGRFTKMRARGHRKPSFSGFPKPDPASSSEATEPQFFVEPPDIQDDNFYSGVYDAADSGSNTIQQQVGQAFAKLRSVVTMEQLAAAIESGTLDQVLDGVDFANFETDLRNALRVTILAIVDASGTESAKLLQDQVAGAPSPLPKDEQPSSWKIEYSPASHAAVDWAKQYAANLVSQVSDETKQAIRDAVVAGIQAGKTNAGRRGQPIGGIAKDIHPLIGLTSQQAATLGNYRTQLEGQAVPATQIDKLVAKKSNELLRDRAELIAKTEGIKAMNQGQYFTWQQAVASKTLNDSYARRIWVTYGDERVCPICTALSTQIVKMDEPFTDLDGNTLMVPGAHPRCRCRQSLTFVTPEPAQASEELFTFFDHAHDARGRFASTGSSGFAHHQGKINATLGTLTAKAKGGKITESAAYHGGKELKAHAKAALADEKMTPGEHAYLGNQLKQHTGMSTKELDAAGPMGVMKTLQGSFKPGAKIGDLAKEEPKASPSFTEHQKRLNDALATLDAKAKNGVVSEHSAYNDGKALKQAAHAVVADTQLSSEERAHLSTQLKAHTGMTAEEMVNSSQMGVMKSLVKNYSPGKKIADLGPAEEAPAKPAELTKAQPPSGHAAKLEEIMSNYHGGGSGYTTAGKLVNLAKTTQSDPSLSPADKSALNAAFKQHTGMTVAQTVSKGNSYAGLDGVKSELTSKYPGHKDSSPAGMKPSGDDEGFGTVGKPAVHPGLASLNSSTAHAKDIEGLLKSALTQPAGTAFMLKAKAKEIEGDKSLLPEHKEALSKTLEDATGMGSKELIAATPSKIIVSLTINSKNDPIIPKLEDTKGPVPTYAGWKENLSPAEHSAVKAYTNGSYMKINKALREGDASSPSVKHIDAAFEKALPSAGMTVIRSMPHSFIPVMGEDLVGHDIVDKGYVSTTKASNPVFPGTHIHILIPPGSKVMDISAISHYAHEQEVLLPRNSHLKVTKAIKGSDGMWSYEATFTGVTEQDPAAHSEAKEDSAPDDENWRSPEYRAARFTWAPGDFTII